MLTCYYIHLRYNVSCICVCGLTAVMDSKTTGGIMIKEYIHDDETLIQHGSARLITTHRLAMLWCCVIAIQIKPVLK